MAWREYHELTKHSPESLRQSRHFLDWRNMPEPFRHYEGVPVLDLPADPPTIETPALDVLLGAPGATSADDGAAFLSQLLFHSAAISASKLVPSTGYRYALRVNPSSGNLHPTEFHFITRGLMGWPDGLYHYRPSAHIAEQRARGFIELPGLFHTAPIVFILTSIAWREAWKYQQRAYRYCLHDIGHAWGALELAARAMGCETFGTGDFLDDDVARACRLAEDEWPMLLVALDGGSVPKGEVEGGEVVWFGGAANRLSDETVEYPLIDEIHAATKVVWRRPRTDTGAQVRRPSSTTPSSGLPFGEVVRARRSALDFQGGDRTMPRAALSAILSSAADFGARYVQLYLYVHRVDDVAPGVYRHWPEREGLELVRSGDQRVAAAGLSLGQDLAGNACVAFSMIADLDRATGEEGDRGYRHAHFEAGAIGQRLYLAAEATGLRATGIGAFFDDSVHRYLDISPAVGQVIYHFAIGHAIHDPRLEA